MTNQQDAGEEEWRKGDGITTFDMMRGTAWPVMDDETGGWVALLSPATGKEHPDP